MADRPAEQQAGTADRRTDPRDRRSLDQCWSELRRRHDRHDCRGAAEHRRGVFGALPWIPKVKLHNLFLAYENGDEFLKSFRLAAEGRLEHFLLVVEGSIPNEDNKSEGYCLRWLEVACFQMFMTW